jgi:uncharacterized membrane protein YtjA (UPF0391 family)
MSNPGLHTRVLAELLRAFPQPIRMGGRGAFRKVRSVMNLLPELWMLVALVGAAVGFGTFSPVVARVGQGVFMAGVVLTMLTMLIESWNNEETTVP